MPVDPRGALAGLGGDGFAGDVTDSFAVDLVAGQQLTVYTQTPFDNAAGSPLNDLDPVLKLYDSNGLAVASATADQPDSKNARLVFVAITRGVYRLEVSAAGGAGEYVLQTEIQSVELPRVTDTGLNGIGNKNRSAVAKLVLKFDQAVTASRWKRASSRLRSASVPYLPKSSTWRSNKRPRPTVGRFRRRIQLWMKTWSISCSRTNRFLC